MHLLALHIRVFEVSFEPSRAHTIPFDVLGTLRRRVFLFDECNWPVDLAVDLRWCAFSCKTTCIACFFSTLAPNWLLWRWPQRVSRCRRQLANHSRIHKLSFAFTTPSHSGQAIQVKQITWRMCICTERRGSRIAKQQQRRFHTFHIFALTLSTETLSLRFYVFSVS